MKLPVSYTHLDVYKRQPVNCDYMFSELVKPIFTKDGEQVKVSVSVKYLDQRTKATQISQFDLTLEKDSNWKIVK